MTSKLFVDPEAFYTGPDLKDHIINTDEKGIHHYRIPIDKFVNEEARQKYAEQFLLVMYGAVKGKNYAEATVNDEGKIIYYPYELVFEMEKP